MSEAIGQVLSFAVGVAISPLPIVAVVLMLSTPRARVNGPAFLIGWTAGLAILGTIVLLVSGGIDASDEGEPATWVSVLKLVLGAALLALAVKQWRGRPTTGEGELPKWMRAIDDFGPGKALGIGVLLAAVNPKNLLLTIGAAAAIAQTDIEFVQQELVLAIFILIATIGVGAPIVIYYTLGDRSAPLLERLKSWLAANNTAIMAVLMLVIGAKLLGDGISGL